MELCEAVTRTPAARPLRRSSEPAKKWRATARTGASMAPQVVMLAGALVFDHGTPREPPPARALPMGSISTTRPIASMARIMVQL
jgi:hypothetical protein